MGWKKRGRAVNELINAYALLVFAEPFKTNCPVDQRKEGMIPSNTHIGTRVNLCAPLSDNDIPRFHKLTAETLHAKPLALAVPAVPGTSSRLFMCHFLILSTDLDRINP